MVISDYDDHDDNHHDDEMEQQKDDNEIIKKLSQQQHEIRMDQDQKQKQRLFHTRIVFVCATLCIYMVNKKFMGIRNQYGQLSYVCNDISFIDLSNLLGLCSHCLCFCIAFVIAAVGASDFCIGTPDDRVTVKLNNNRDQLDSIIYYGMI